MGRRTVLGGKVKVRISQSCSTLCNPMGCSSQYLIQDITGLEGCPRNVLDTFGNPGADESQIRERDEVYGNYCLYRRDN